MTRTNLTVIAPQPLIRVVGVQGPAGASGVTENVILQAVSTPGTLSLGDIVMPDVSLDKGVKEVVDNKQTYPAIGIVTEVDASGNVKFLHIGFSTFAFAGISRGDRIWIGTSGIPATSPVTDGYLHEVGYCYEDTFLFFDFTKTRLKRSPF